MKNSPSIVLTATIIPNAILTEHSDFMQRRAEYLKAIDFYQRFADVYFLENSSYDLASDAEFSKYKNVHIRKFPISGYPQKGKGFQEFEMLDAWLSAEVSPPSHWIKVTGRYIVQNFSEILQDCSDSKEDELMIERKFFHSKFARTDIFCVRSSFYQSHLLGAYQHCNDASRRYIEHVISSKIKNLEHVRVFGVTPLIVRISGSTGRAYKITPIEKIKYWISRLAFQIYKKHRLI